MSLPPPPTTTSRRASIWSPKCSGVDWSHFPRPTWTAAAPGPVAEPLVDAVVAELRARGAEVSTGVFGADMRVDLVNDGPFTVVLDIGS